MSDDWYKRDVRAALKGMATLTLEERGAYNTILDYLYLFDGPLEDDDTYIAGLIGCHANKWKAIKAVLIAKGRLRVEGGKVDDDRAVVERQGRHHIKAERTQAGHKGGVASGKSRKTAAPTEANASTPSNQIREDKIREDNKGATAPPGLTPRQELERVLDAERSNAVVEHRQKIKKPLTAHGARLLSGKFARCRDPNAAADKMIERGWQGFEPEWMEDRNSQSSPGDMDRLDAI